MQAVSNESGNTPQLKKQQSEKLTSLAPSIGKYSNISLGSIQSYSCCNETLA